MGPYPPRVRRDLDVDPEGQLSPRASSMSPSQSAITLCGWGFPTLRGSIDPGDLRFRPRVVGIVDRVVGIVDKWKGC